MRACWVVAALAAGLPDVTLSADPVVQAFVDGEGSPKEKVLKKKVVKEKVVKEKVHEAVVPHGADPGPALTSRESVDATPSLGPTLGASADMSGAATDKAVLPGVPYHATEVTAPLEVQPEKDSSRAPAHFADQAHKQPELPPAGVEAKDGKKKEAPMDLTPYFKLLAVILAVLCVAVMWFENWVWRTDWLDAGPEPDAEEQGQRLNLNLIFRGLRTLSAPYWSSEGGRQKGTSFGVTLVFFLGLSLFTSFVHNMWRQQFWDNFEEGGTQVYFVHLILILIVVIGVEMLAGVYSQYVRWLLYIDWRHHMTSDYIDRWLRDKAYCEVARMKAVDNPDQRVQEDVGIYTERTINLTYNACHEVGHLMLFLPLLLWTSPSNAFGLFYCPGWLFYLVASYALFGTFAAHHLGQKLIPINFAKQRREADFRYELVEVRDHSDAIAMMGAENQMHDRIGGKFKSFRDAWWHYMQTYKRLMYFKHFFSTVNWLVPFTILAPSYFANELTLGELFQLIHVVGKVETSLDWIINSYEPISDWRATADRLLAFETAVESHGHVLKAAPAPPTAAVEAEDLALVLPDGRELWTCARISLPRGWVLLEGEDGCGKTSLLKMLSGLWPCPGATVKISSQRVFVPEEPFTPASSLREAVLYPAGAQRDDATLQEALRDVGLERLLEGGLDAESDWARALNTGERQRLVAAQLLVQPAPDTLFLDEAFSHVEPEAARRILARLRERCPAMNVVHVSHDIATMQPVHDVHMRASVVKSEFSIVEVAH